MSRRKFFRLGSLSGAALLMSVYPKGIGTVSPDAAVLDSHIVAKGSGNLSADEVNLSALPCIRVGTTVTDTLALSDGSLLVILPGADDHPLVSYSRDGGVQWEEPIHMQYADGRAVKVPLTAGVTWKFENGKFLSLYSEQKGSLAWLLGGEEVDGLTGKVIRWSQPEILIYSEAAPTPISHPDLLQYGEYLYISVIQKVSAKVHAIPPKIPQALWGQFERAAVNRDGLLAEYGMPLMTNFAAPSLPKFWDKSVRPANRCSGFTLEFWLRVYAFDGVEMMLDGRDENGRGVFLQVDGDKHCLGLGFSDGLSNAFWESDPDSLHSDDWLHAAVVVDGGPCIISWITDGQFNDGGTQRQYGWGRFPAALRDVNGAAHWQVNPMFDGEIAILRVYDRTLLTSEVISNWRAQGSGMGKTGFEIQV